MKYILVAIVSLAIGYFSRPVPKTEPFDTFIQTEAKKYAEATDADAKLKAADEMYGKIMLLLLAEVGTRARPEASKPVLINLPDKTECPPLIAPETTVTSVSTPESPPVAPVASEKKLKPEEVAKENWAKYATTPYLDTFQGKDRRMLGRFEGVLQRANREDTIVMQFNLIETKKEITGETFVTMTDPNGKEYSRNAGNGGNRSIKSADSENGYYIEASPSSYFLINLKHYPQISGKYFEKGKFIGDVQLRKVGI